MKFELDVSRLLTVKSNVEDSPLRTTKGVAPRLGVWRQLRLHPVGTWALATPVVTIRARMTSAALFRDPWNNVVHSLLHILFPPYSSRSAMSGAKERLISSLRSKVRA